MRSTVGLVVLVVIALAVGILLGSAAAGGGILGGQPTASPAPRTPRPTPSPTPADTGITASAVVVPNRSAELSVSVAGRVASVLVSPDQGVIADQLLLRLDDSNQQAAVDLARADVRRAEAAAERARLLLDALPEDAPVDELEAAQLDLRLAEAELEVARSVLAEAQIALRETELRAPFEGTVIALRVTEGEQAAVGIPVLTIADLSGWLVETTDLGELDVVRVAVGDSATITFEALPAVELAGTVARIQVRGTTEEGAVRFGVLIRPDQHLTDLRWNMSATVRIEPGR